MKTWLIAGLLCMAMVASAQKNVTTQSLLWAINDITLSIDSNWQVKQVIEERTYWFPWQQHQLLVGVSVGYRFNKNWRTAAGFTYFIQTQPQNPFREITANNMELRPLIELGNTSKINKRLSIDHRYRAEFRFFEQPTGGFKFNSVRFRYKVELRVQIVDKLKLYLYNEIHISAGKAVGNNIFNQNRVGGGFVYQALPKLGIELGYLNWYQELGSGIDRFNRHIVKLAIHHKFQLKPAKHN